MESRFHSRLFSLFTVLVLDYSAFTSQDEIRVKNYKSVDSVFIMSNANNIRNVLTKRNTFPFQ